MLVFSVPEGIFLIATSSKSKNSEILRTTIWPLVFFLKQNYLDIHYSSALSGSQESGHVRVCHLGCMVPTRQLPTLFSLDCCLLVPDE